MAGLFIENISKTFKARDAAPVTALDRFSLEVRSGELLVLLGPSGCGKTTLLRLIAGLDEPSSGQISLDGRSLADEPPQRRSIGMAFQYPALLPQLTVQENITLGPKLRGVAHTESTARARELAHLLAISDLLPRYPETLSGGQQQRVSLARALANRPALLLLDEPLANLDPLSRHELREAVRTIQQQLGVTTLHVTHDQSEAAALADRIALIKNGALQQIGTAQELYLDPANLFVAEFFGPDRPNVLPGELIDGFFQATGCDARFPVGTKQKGKAVCVLRPRAVRAGGDLTSLVDHVQNTGWNSMATLKMGNLRLRAELPSATRLNQGDALRFSIDPDGFLLFDAGSGVRLR